MKKPGCWPCGLSYGLLKLVAGADHASDVLWSETPFPAGECEHVRPVLLREAWRVALWRLRIRRTAGGM